MSSLNDDSASEPESAAISSSLSAAPSRKRKRANAASELEPEKLEAFEAAEHRKGLVYISRVPPFMKPAKLRHLMEPYGAIGKIYMAPEGKWIHSEEPGTIDAKKS